MGRIPDWAYPETGLGEGRVAWMRGFLRVTVFPAGTVVAVLWLGWWALLVAPLLFLATLVFDALLARGRAAV